MFRETIFDQTNLRLKTKESFNPSLNLGICVWGFYFTGFWRPSELHSLRYILKSKRTLMDHSFSTYAKFSEKRIFLTPWDAHVRLRIRSQKYQFLENSAYILNEWPLGLLRQTPEYGFLIHFSPNSISIARERWYRNETLTWNQLKSHGAHWSEIRGKILTNPFPGWGYDFKLVSL